MSPAEETFSSTYSNGYTLTLEQVGGPPVAHPLAQATCNAAVRLHDTLTTPPSRKSGYGLGYEPEDPPLPNPPAACGTAGFNVYLTTPIPVVVGQTGQTRQTSYCSNEPRVSHYAVCGAQAASQAAWHAVSTLR